MKHLYYFILILIIAGQFGSCSYTQLNSNNCHDPIYIVAPFDNDSLYLSPETRFFYRYKTEVVGGNYNPYRVLSVLYCLHGIRVTEAWYGSGSRKINEGITRNTIHHIPPLIIGISNDTSDIWRYHFALDTVFDPIKAYKNQTTHLIFKGFNVGGA